MDEIYKEVFKAQQQEKEPIFSASLFQEYLRTKLIQLFDQIEGKKHLVFDDCVKVVLNLSVDGTTIKDHGIENISNIKDTKHENLAQNKIFIFVQPKVEYLDKIKEFLDLEAKANLPSKKGNTERVKKEFYVVYWPKRTILCKEAQIERNITDEQIKIIDFSFDLIPIDQDILSLEMPDTFNSMYLDSDFSTYSYVAESIQRFQIIFGKIPNVFYKGEGPAVVMEILNSEEEAGGNKNIDASQSDFETMIILDRNIDFLTPLCSQLVYEGLVDDFFGITANFLKIDSNLLKGDNPPGQKPKQTTIKLSSEGNQVYQQIRDKQISQSREILTSSAQEIQRVKEIITAKKKGATPQDIEKCLKIIEKITRDQKHVEDHINLSCTIVERMRTIQFYKDLLIEQSAILGVAAKQCLEYVETMIGLGEPIQKVLKLLCIQSLVDNGIKQNQFDEIRKEIIQEYGIKHLLTLQRFQQIGLLKRQDGSKNLWPKLKEELELVDEKVEIDNPTSPAYAFSGYCPLTVRLIEHVLRKKTWKHITDSLKNIPGRQSFPQDASKQNTESAILVYFIGGITYGEISAIRLLAKLARKEIVIATTHLINNKKMLSSLIEEDL